MYIIYMCIHSPVHFLCSDVNLVHSARLREEQSTDSVSVCSR